MFDSLFGAEPSVAKFVIAFAVVIGLIALTAWLVRRFGANRLGNGVTRGRQPRLAVIDAAAIDSRRRLVLIRRDNIEHLLMIGGPSDVVVEPNIVRAATRETTRSPSDTLPRTLPLDNGASWPLQPSPEPAPVATPAPSARGQRAAFGEESWTAGETPPAREPAMRDHAPRDAMREPALRARPDSLTGIATEFSAKFSQQDFGSSFTRNPQHAETARDEPQVAPQVETFGRVAPPVETHLPEPSNDRTDHNLAEMASRLEAALRRPPQPEGRPPVTDPLAVESARRVPDLKTPDAKAPDVKAPEVRTAQVDKAPDVKAPPANAADPASEVKPAKDNKAASKAIYDSLEQEMASLLGRPATK